MDKRKIESFAVNARNKLRQEVIDRLRLIGITVDEINNPLPQSDKITQYFDIGISVPYSLSGEDIEKRENLINDLNSYIDEFKSQDSKLTDKKAYEKAFDKLVEEAAYTWFNRLIALRFLEVNDFLPGHVRVLSSTDERREPEIINYPFELDIDFNSTQVKEIEKLKSENKNEDLYKLLILELGHRLNKELPFLFGENKDYYDLLFPLSYSNQDCILNNLISQIPEEDFDISQGGQVEIIGWLYQFYNSELKQQTLDSFKKNKKVTKENFPYATQLFTPDWIVKYMVDNSLGRLWIDHLCATNSDLNPKDIANEFGLDYYFPSIKQSSKVEAELKKINNNLKDLTPEDLTIIDPAMGSGHILSYAFDVLMKIYSSEGYRERDAAKLILEKNLFGLDIDKRASQLAKFSILVKARKYNRRIFKDQNLLNLYEIPEISEIDFNYLSFIGNSLAKEDKIKFEELINLVKEFKDSKLTGSLIKLKNYSYIELKDFLQKLKQNLIKTADNNTLDKFTNLINIAEILSQQYQIVVTNPPYLGTRYFNKEIKKFFQNKFSKYKSDLFSAFIKRCIELNKKEGYSAFMSPYVWMFIQSYENFREFLLKNETIISLIQCEYNSFEEAKVPICTFILRNTLLGDYKGNYIRLVDFKGNMEVQREKSYKAIKGEDTSYLFNSSSKNFNLVPGSPIAYWISDNMLSAFENGTPLGELADSRHGMFTGDNKKFTRLWNEVNINQINFNAHNLNEANESKLKWFPYNKGGKFRKWYGNNDFILNYQYDGKELKDFKDSNGKIKSGISNSIFFFKPSFSWSLISSGSAAFRYKPYGFIFDAAGMSFFTNKNLNYLGGLANSPISKYVLDFVAPTINYQAGDIAKIPVITDESKVPEVEELVKENIELSKADWDSFETSWDFKKHPLIRGTSTIEEAYLDWEKEAEERFNKLKENEEELNRIFIDIYNMNSELSPEVEDKYVSVRKADREREIKSLLSYAVGCILGRYSLDEEGLILAGGELEEERYKSFKPDVDGIIPILDQAYFIDDIMDLLSNWLKVVYGEKTLEENLDYIAESLGRKGNKSSRDIIREYFLKNFITDHNKEYRKRPIYWLYDSGRNNGFKALIYQHRYDKNTTGRIAADYLKRTIEVYSSEIDRLTRKSEELKEAGDAKAKREARAIDKQIEKLRKQLNECRDFNEKVQHLANLRISIDLDDGVLVNHAKIQTDENGDNLKILKGF